MEITYQVRVDGEPVRFGHNYATASSAAAWKSYDIWAANPHSEVAIDKLHDGQYFATLRNSAQERLDYEAESEAESPKPHDPGCTEYGPAESCDYCSQSEAVN